MTHEQRRIARHAAERRDRDIDLLAVRAGRRRAFIKGMIAAAVAGYMAPEEARAIGLITQAGPKLFTSGASDAVRTAGSPYGFFNWNLNVAQMDSDATKQAAFAGHGTMTGGATGVVSINDNSTRSDAGGRIWCPGSPSAVNSTYGHTPPAFPGGASRALCLEIRPRSLGNGSGNEWQSDAWVLLGTWRPCIAVRFWQYLLPVCSGLELGSTMATNDKEFYPANEQAGGPPYGHYFLLEGWRVENHDNGLRASLDRTSFLNGTRPRNQFASSFTSKGMGGSDVSSRLSYTGGTDNLNNPSTDVGMGAGPALDTSAVLEKFMSNGTWYEKTYFVDHTQAQGKAYHWLRAYGETAATLMWGFDGGVTSGYSWPVPTSVSANGNTVNLRTANQICKFPTVASSFGTTDGYDTSAEGDYIKLMVNLELADSVAQLSTYGCTSYPTS